MAEESLDPRAGVAKAVFSSIALVAVVYVFLSYATVVGFDNNAAKLTSANVPMVDAAQGVASFLAFLAYIAGFTSILSSLISAANSQARIIFSSGREGLPRGAGGRARVRRGRVPAEPGPRPARRLGARRRRLRPRAPGTPTP